MTNRHYDWVDLMRNKHEMTKYDEKQKLRQDMQIAE